MSPISTCVCIICLQRFRVESSPTDNVPSSILCGDLVPSSGPNLKSPTEPESARVLNSEQKSRDDLYTRFLKLTRRFLHVPMGETLLRYASRHKSSGGEVLPAFCDSCQMLVESVCDLYSVFQTMKLNLLRKVEQLEMVTRNATKKVSQKLSSGLLKAVTEQLHIKSSNQLVMFRRTFLVGCRRKIKGTVPQVIVHRGLFPEECKYTFAATERALIQLIVIFALATTKPKASQEETTAENISKRRKRILKQHEEKENETFADIPTEGADIKQEMVIKTEGEDGEANVGDDSLFSDHGDGSPEWDVGGNDSDWAGSQVSSESADMNAPPPKRTIRLRRTRSGISSSTAARDIDDDNQTSEEDDDKDPEFKMEEMAKPKLRRPPKRNGSNSKYSNPKSKLKQLPRDHAKISCKLCQKTFITRSSLDAHLVNFHNEQVHYSCQLCGLKCADHKELREHKTKVHKIESSTKKQTRYRPHNPKATLSCSKCDKKYVDAKGLSMHMAFAHRKRREYICEVCGHESRTAMDHLNHRRHLHKKKVSFNEYTSHLNLKKQIKADPKEMARSCAKCNLTFPTRAEHLDHCNEVHNGRLLKFECPICNARFTFDNDSRFKEHLTFHHLEESHVLHRFHCEVCGITFDTQDNLSTHFKEVHQESYNCSLCPSRFETFILLRDHLNCHETEIKNFFCGFCYRGYTNEQYWQVHQKVAHKGIERIFCSDNHCAEEFTSVHDLNEHLQSHLVSKDINASSTTAPSIVNNREVSAGYSEVHKCKTCGWGFLRRQELTLHELRHMVKTAGGNYRCPADSCGKPLPLMDLFISHYNYVHQRNYYPYKCQQCNHEFSSFTWYKVHLKLHLEGKGGRQFSCDVCQLECEDPIQLEHHKQTHNPRRGRPPKGSPAPTTEEQRWKERQEAQKYTVCEVCKIKFPGYSIRMHVDFHEEKVPEEEKRVQCVHCHKKFGYQQSYQFHCSYAHRSDCPIVCDVDECLHSQYSTVEDLNDHLKLAHLQNPEAETAALSETEHTLKVNTLSFCQVCGWGFVNPDYRDLHQLVHTPPFSKNCYICSDCGSRFSVVSQMMGEREWQFTNSPTMTYDVEVKLATASLSHAIMAWQR